jgi:hypothetical protein
MVAWTSFAHEVCSAATLVQTAGGVQEAVIKGLRYRECGLKDSLPRGILGKVIREVAREGLRVVDARFPPHF